MTILTKPEIRAFCKDLADRINAGFFAEYRKRPELWKAIGYCPRMTGSNCKRKKKK